MELGPQDHVPYCGDQPILTENSLVGHDSIRIVALSPNQKMQNQDCDYRANRVWKSVQKVRCWKMGAHKTSAASELNSGVIPNPCIGDTRRGVHQHLDHTNQPLQILPFFEIKVGKIIQSNLDLHHATLNLAEIFEKHPHLKYVDGAPNLKSGKHVLLQPNRDYLRIRQPSNTQVGGSLYALMLRVQVQQP